MLGDEGDVEQNPEPDDKTEGAVDDRPNVRVLYARAFGKFIQGLTEHQGSKGVGKVERVGIVVHTYDRSYTNRSSTDTISTVERGRKSKKGWNSYGHLQQITYIPSING